uniref:Uncharacterized protein n=1 Tax=Arundo donax TaxID=35708 RepID=A0A0A8YEN1_ARUDO
MQKSWLHPQAKPSHRLHILGSKTSSGTEQMHYVGFAALSWTLWTTRNAIVFDQFKLNEPNTIIYKMCSFILHWAGLQSQEDRKHYTWGVNFLQQRTKEIVAGGSSSTSDLVPK